MVMLFYMKTYLPQLNAKRTGLAVTLFALVASTLPALPSNARVVPDAGFGVRGKVVTDLFSDYNDANDVKIQSDGKIVVVGIVNESGSENMVITRYAANGELDPEFGEDGVVTVDVNLNADAAQALAIQEDGKLVVVGTTYPTSSNEGDFLVVRLQTNGDPDPTFGTNGITTIDFSSRSDDAAAIAINPSDGSMLVAGVTFLDPVREVGIAKLDSTGSLVPTFGSSGKVQTDLGGDQIVMVSSINLDSSQRIVVAGSTAQLADYEMFVARYDTTGVLDDSFGDSSTGILRRQYVTDPSTANLTIASGLTIQRDGKILVTGYFMAGPTFASIFLSRFSASGADDTTFANDGMKALNAGEEGSGTSIAVQRDGKILVGGYSYIEGKGAQATLIRFTRRGRIQRSFGTNGMFTVGSSDHWEYVNGMVRTSDGSVILAGTIEGGDTDDAFLYRLKGSDLVLPAKPSVYIGSGLRLRPIARYLGLQLPTGSTITARVESSSSTICKIERGALRGLKRGRCVVRVTVTRSDDTSVSRRVTLITRRSFG